jgi:ATP phosphoribosyltransferase regulatory subunit
VLTVLCGALDATGLRTYRVGLGDASLYPGLLEAAGVDPQRRERILAELVAGDFVGVQRELDSLELQPTQRSLLMGLARTRGGPEVLEGHPEPLEKALGGLRAVYGLLGEQAAERIIVDLGLVRNLGYYTGAVFQVYDPAHGVPIGQGGRYDQLLARFGRPLPAVGFALGVERVHIALAGEERGLGTWSPERAT